MSSPVPHRWQFTVDASGLKVGNHYKAPLGPIGCDVVVHARSAWTRTEAAASSVGAIPAYRRDLQVLELLGRSM